MPAAPPHRHGLPRLQRHTGAPASRGIWKHLKLPRGRPGALRARPHTRLEHCSDPLQEPAVPYGHSRPVGSLAGPLSKSTGLPNAKRIGTTTCTVLHLTGQESNQDPPGQVCRLHGAKAKPSSCGQCPVTHRWRGGGRLPAARLSDSLLPGLGMSSVFLNSGPTDLWLGQFCITDKPPCKPFTITGQQ